MELESQFSSILRIFQTFGIEFTPRWLVRLGFGSNVVLVITIVILLLDTKFELFVTPDGIDSGFVSDIIKFVILYSVVNGLWLDSYVFRRQKMEQVLGKLHDVDKLVLFVLKIDIDDHYEKMARVFRAKFFATLFLLFSSTAYWYLTTRISLKTVFVLQCANLVLILKVWQSLLHVTVLRSQLKILTESLEELIALFGFNAVLKNRNYQKFLIAKAKTLFILFDRIYDYANTLNEYFGYPFCGVVASNSIQLITSIYWGVFNVYNCDWPVLISISEFRH
jgi:7tm Chemosensory receptor